MQRVSIILMAVLVVLTTISCKKSNEFVVLQTNQGDINLELFTNDAPETVENFLYYVESDFYSGTIFHRVIKNFMIQGGGFTSGLGLKQTMKPIFNEAKNGLKNTKGTIAMARTNAPHSATSQFFINLKDNSFLDHGVRDYGYCVFGKVVKGMDVVDKIAGVETKTVNRYKNVPVEEVVILSAKRIDASKQK